MSARLKPPLRVFNRDVLVVGANGPFRRIADAIASASAGQTIFVNPGTYDEYNMTLPAGVSLVGVHPSVCRIHHVSDATGPPSSPTHVILFLGGDNYVSGLSLKCTSGASTAIFISGTTGNLIRQCDLRGDTDTIGISGGGQAVFERCLWDGTNFDHVVITGSSTLVVKQSRVVMSPTIETTASVEPSFVNGAGGTVNLMDNIFEITRASGLGAFSWLRSAAAIAYNLYNNLVLVTRNNNRFAGLRAQNGSGATFRSFKNRLVFASGDGSGAIENNGLANTWEVYAGDITNTSSEHDGTNATLTTLANGWT